MKTNIRRMKTLALLLLASLCGCISRPDPTTAIQHLRIHLPEAASTTVLPELTLKDAQLVEVLERMNCNLSLNEFAQLHARTTDEATVDLYFTGCEPRDRRRNEWTFLKTNPTFQAPLTFHAEQKPLPEMLDLLLDATPLQHTIHVNAPTPATSF